MFQAMKREVAVWIRYWIILWRRVKKKGKKEEKQRSISWGFFLQKQAGPQTF